MRYIISTVGTSILTNMINRTTEGTSFGILNQSANLKDDELVQVTNSQTVIDTLAGRAESELKKNNDQINRKISAELNGIYGIYGGNLPASSQDRHCLICTDTAQGQVTGNLIKDFLETRGFPAEIVVPSQLSTRDTDVFTAGIKDLIKWLENNVSWQQDSAQDEVIFNLVGGFKSLQGYMQTFGTFYANTSVYIFEGSSQLIEIPRLPIKIDTSVIENHILEFAMMAAGEMYPVQKLGGIPETLLEPVVDNGITVAGLSAWGELIWSRAKADLLAKALLPFSRLEYLSRFYADFNNENAPKARLELQETLAQVAYALDTNNGSTESLTEGGLRFKPLNKFPGIFTFRVARGIRVSCSKGNGTLKLHRYGPRNTVHNNPN